MKTPLPGRSAAYSAPTGGNAAQITGAVKDLEACRSENGIALASNGFATAIQLVRGLAPLIPRQKKGEYL